MTRPCDDCGGSGELYLGDPQAPRNGQDTPELWRTCTTCNGTGDQPEVNPDLEPADDYEPDYEAVMDDRRCGDL